MTTKRPPAAWRQNRTKVAIASIAVAIAFFLILGEIIDLVS
jgi:hypothetical protein